MDKNVVLHAVHMANVVNNGGGVVVSTIANMLRISKGVARRRLDNLVDGGWLELRVKYWRPNSQVHYYVPSIKCKQHIKKGVTKQAYNAWLASIVEDTIDGVQLELF